MSFLKSVGDAVSDAVSDVAKTVDSGLCDVGDAIDKNGGKDFHKAVIAPVTGTPTHGKGGEHTAAKIDEKAKPVLQAADIKYGKGGENVIPGMQTAHDVIDTVDNAKHD
jgi:hypothetical protein